MNYRSLLLSALLLWGGFFSSFGQSFCPTNIDFELGTTNNWTYYRGSVATGPTYTFSGPIAAVPGLHTLTSSAASVDYYGGFPIVAPGGGAYSMRLGKDSNNHCAERARYFVHIPAGTTDYSLVYHYAVVMENPAGHSASEMPRLVVDAYDSLTGDSVACISYTYVSTGGIPGFTNSGVTSTIAGNGMDVVYKPWTLGNMKFPGYNGRTVTIEFTANACTLGGHFGYGYFDMTCGLFAISVSSCGTSTATVNAPPGYSAYSWFDSSTFSISYGTTASVSIPVPGVPTTYAVICIPYSGYGCPDTLYTRLNPTLLLTSPSHDTAICAGSTITLSPNSTDISLPLTYNWIPSTGLSCPTCGTTNATPVVTTTYAVTTTDAGGCVHTDNITVTVSPTPAAIPDSAACIGVNLPFTDGVAGGVWTSSNTGIATIGSISGLAGGVSAGTTTISYSFGSGLCAASRVITVSPLPPNISGAPSVCIGSTITLTDGAGPGRWTTSSSSTATVGSASGIVGGVINGTATITYMAPSGCSKSVIVTVNLGPGAIIGATSVCAGITTSLTDGVGGTWLSSNTGVATVGSSTGIVGGVIPGTSVITYTATTGCTTSIIMTVNISPPGITGTLNVCAGLTTLLADGVTGGTWISSNTAFATVSSTGVVTGVSAPSATITYYAPGGGGCFAIAALTVNPLPTAISPASPNVCVGAVTPLTDPGGGTWSSANTLMATVSPAGGLTGVGVAGGTTTITYTLPTGCQTTSPITVNPLPSAIFGPHTICEGGNVIVLNDTTLVGLGTWISSNTSVANIDPFSGTVTSGIAGVTTISYDLLTDGCTITTVLTVNPNPGEILGSTQICPGTTVSLIDATTGGIWTSSSTAIGTVGSLSGIVTGGFDTTTASSFVITYTLPTGCANTLPMTLYPLPHSIAGTFHLCAGQSLSLSDPSSPGVWSSSNNIIATVTPGPGGGGVVTGVNPGVDSITFTILGGSGCARTTPVTVNSTPLGITGNPGICLGSTSALTDAGGGTWTSSNATVATAGFTTGIVGCIAANTATITYSLGGTCASTITVTCHALPAAISGALDVCVGAPTALSDPAGPGTWASGNTAIATVGPGTGTVNVYGASPGTAIITYTPPTGCSRTAILTVNPLPTPCPIGGGGAYCSGTPAPHIVDSCSTAGIVYKIYNGATMVPPSILGTGLLIDFGSEPGAGTYTVTATTSFGCTATMPGSVVIGVNPLPGAYTVAGGGPYCAGTGGVHIRLLSSDAPVSSCHIIYQAFLGITPVGPAVTGTGGPLDFGLVTTAGTYTVIATNSCTGCTRTMTGSVVVSISPIPSITGASAVCVGASITESVPGFSGGTWGSSNTAIASVSPAGVVTGGSTGPVTITYTSSSGCSASTVITVSLSPRPITGPNSVCLGATAAETDTVGGGIWSVTNTAAIVGSSLAGNVTGVGLGTTTVVYSLGGSGCTMTKTLLITPAPAAIAGAPGLCYLTTTSLTDINTGGTWTSGNTSVATVNSGTGLVLGLDTGTAIITYTLGGCTATIIVTVAPAPGLTAGPSSVCAGSSVLFSNPIGGGTWTSSSTLIAAVDGGGNVQGFDPGGLDTITYSLGGSCVATKTITVNAIYPIGGATGLCLGNTTTLTGAPSGGTWSSSNNSVASLLSSIGSPVLVSGLASGTATITYTTIAGCTAIQTLTVNLAPLVVTGNLHVCLGLCTQLSDAAGGGTWSTPNTDVTVDPTGGLVCGIVPGTATITYSLGFGCTKSAVVTVNSLPGVIGGLRYVCSGGSTTLIDATTGGTWAVLHSLVAAVGLTSGTVDGEIPGLDTVVYTAPSGCSVSAPITVNPLPSPIYGITSICVGSSTNLSDGTTGGTWFSTNTSVAVVDPFTGLVTGDSPGTTTITYTLPLTGCSVFIILTVLPPPPPITGAPMVCAGQSTTLHNAASGGVWSTGPSSLAIINPSTGVLTGVSSGTVLVSYTIGCSVISSIIVNALSPVMGSNSVCAGLDIILTDTTAAGAWSSDNTALATVIAGGLSTGIVGGVAPGVDTIIYTLPTGCAASKTVTVNPAPPPVAGVLSVCAGSTTTLIDVPGGTWTSGNTAVATMVGNVVHAGVTTGVVSISYMLPGTGCPAIAMVTVNPVPPAIGGPSAVCFTPGTTITLTDALTGGIWSSASTTVTIDSFSGVLTGNSIGSANVLYTMPWGCSAATLVSVVTPPAAIGGVPVSVCAGSMVTLTDATSGGSWASGSISIATVDASGNVWGVAGGFGPVLISYAVVEGCPAIAIVTVNPLPDAIVGTTTICQGSGTTLTDGTPGGSWMSSDTTVAHIDASTGYVFANGYGSTMIVFTAPSGCSINTLLSVNPMPAPITGSSAICLGNTTLLSDAGIGSWNSSNAAIASVDPTGTVYGLSAGTALISYSPGGCAATFEVTVAPTPLNITGNTAVCSGAATILGDPVTGGTWSSSNTAVATVDMFSGAVTGITTVLDVADITYSTGAGCNTDVIVTVNPLPAAITGTSHVCADASAPVFDATGGGNWSSSNTAIATIPPSSGVYTGVNAGAATIIYTLGTGCAVAYPVTVNPMPSPISGSPYICLGATGELTDAVSGGTWSVTPAGIVSLASPSSGIIGGASLGSAGICYTLGFGCTVCTNVTVEPLPAVYNVTGGGSYCNGGSGVPIGLDGSHVGVNYLLYRGVVATGTFAGSGAPFSFGLQSVAGPYTVIAITTSTGCTNIMAGSAVVTIMPTVAPTVNISTGSDTVCSGTSATFAAVPGYGGLTPAFIWTVNGVAVGAAPAYTFVPANGDVVGVTMSSTGTCPSPATASNSLTMTVFAHEMPVANVVVAPGSEVCKGSAVSLHSVPAYGGPSPTFAWTKNGTAVGSGPTYAYLPSDGDMVYVRMTSDYLCRLADAVISDTVTIRVDTPLTPVVSIIAKPGADVAIGQFDTLTAAVGSDGVLSYQWVVNELPVSGATSNTFISNNFSNASQDSVTCVVVSEGVCTASSFGWVYIHTHPEGVTQLQQNGSDISILPNPNTGAFTVKGYLGGSLDEDVSLEVTDMLGQVVYKKQVTAHNGKLNEQVLLNNALSNGMYLLNLRSDEGNSVFHIVVER